MSHDNTNDSTGMQPVTNDSTGQFNCPASGTPPEQAQNGQAKSVSPQKLAANRANAQHATGPKTPEGKERSKQNARKHGFFARQPLPAGEVGDKLWQAYSDLVAGIWEYYRPVGYMEGLLTEKIVTEAIRFSRLLAYESKPVGEHQAFHWQGVDRILRFQAAINRQIFQAMHELERLQEKRKANASAAGTVDTRVSPASGGLDKQDSGTPCELIDVETPVGVTAARQQTSPPRPQPSDYETKPTDTQLGESDGGAAPTFLRRPETSLADLASKALSLPPIAAPEPPGTDYGTNPTDCSRFIETAEDEELVERIKRGDFDHLEPLE